MKRAKNVFRGAIVEGFGAMIFLLIVAISLPNLLENSNQTMPAARSAIDDTSASEPVQQSAPDTSFKQSNEWHSSLRHAFYEVNVTDERADEGANARGAMTVGNKRSDTISYVDVADYDERKNRNLSRPRFEW